MLALQKILSHMISKKVYSYSHPVNGYYLGYHIADGQEESNFFSRCPRCTEKNIHDWLGNRFLCIKCGETLMEVEDALEFLLFHHESIA